MCNMRNHAFGLLVAVAGVAQACAHDRNTGDDGRGRKSSALYGATVTPDMFSKSGIVATVGMITVNGATGSTNCSGTLVGRNTILLAAHCVCRITGPFQGVTAPASAISGIVFPQAPLPTPPAPAPLALGVFMHPKASAACSLGSEPIGGFDLAVIKLNFTVPATVVEDVARVFLGSIESTFNAGKLLGGTQIGFGKNTNYKDYSSGVDGAGFRRFGLLTNLWTELDPCGVIELDKCNDYLEWHSNVDSSVQSVHAPGDSGGPLFMTHATLGPVVVGVSSGYREDDPTLSADPSAVQMWAPTGDTGSVNNDGFLKPLLGGDGDGDQVPDLADNCPTDPNPDQTDADNDGVGDVCDNCPPERCIGLPPDKFNCVNPKQLDGDVDGVGDTCDVCPEDFSGIGGQTQDQDGDFVGDVCDSCPEQNGYVPCLGSATCDALGAGYCVIDGSGPLLLGGRCSLVVDEDKDARPDACDLCPGFKNFSNTNANPLAEEREVAEPRADECDAVPLVRLAKQKAEPVNQLVPGDGQGPDEIARVSADRWLGRDNQVGGAFTTNQIVAYRHCSCFHEITGVPLELTKCVGATGQCSWATPAISSPGSKWRTPTMQTAAASPILDAAGYTSLLPFSRSVSINFERFWRWRQDVSLGLVDGKGTCTPLLESCSTHGAFFTTVAGPTVSSRDQSDNLRDVFQIIATPAISLKPVIAVPDPGNSSCPNPPCLTWVNPNLYLKDPELLDFANDLIQPVFVEAVGSSVVARTQADAGRDITSSVDSEVRALLGAPSVLWLTPAEPAARVREYPGRGSIQTVAFPRDLSNPRIETIVRTASGLTLSRRRSPTDDVALAAGTPLPVRSREGHGAVLSGIEEAVYVVGGVDSETKAPSQTVLRYDLNHGSWAFVAPHANERPASRVFSVTLDPVRHMLFVLDLSDDRLAGSKIDRLRLLAIDTHTGGSRVLLEVPRSGQHDRLWIQWVEEGVLLFAASPQVLKVWRLTPTASGVEFSGQWTRAGRMLGQPTMGERYPVVPISKGAVFEYVSVTPDLFKPSGPVGTL